VTAIMSNKTLLFFMYIPLLMTTNFYY
jgi:hypothetical protein